MKIVNLAPAFPFHNGAVQLTSYTDGSPALTVGNEVASVNLGAYGLTSPPGHVFIKDYAENQGLTAALVKAGVVEVVRAVRFGNFDSAGYLVKVLPLIDTPDEDDNISHHGSAQPLEKLYLVCLCGEVFDEIDLAADHAEVCGHQPTDWSFNILPESEAL